MICVRLQGLGAVGLNHVRLLVINNQVVGGATKRKRRVKNGIVVVIQYTVASELKRAGLLIGRL